MVELPRSKRSFFWFTACLSVIVNYGECFQRPDVRSRFVANKAIRLRRIVGSTEGFDRTEDHSDRNSSCGETRANVLHKALVLGTSTLLTIGGVNIQNAYPDDGFGEANPVPPVTQISRDVVLTLPSPTRVGTKQQKKVSIPRVGYSFYKTDLNAAPKCLDLALDAGVRHFDVATMYQSNPTIGEALPSLLKKYSLKRTDICIAHKLSNEEQSNNGSEVTRSVKRAIRDLHAGSYLDVCYIHSPLTSRERRIGTYATLCDLQARGIIRAIGVCHYGVPLLNEIVDAGLPPPSVIQLELSPFNQHKDVVEWAARHGSIMSCAAWSKLSSVDGPQDGWAVLAGIAKEKGVTKAQILVRWALQKGYLSVPRSGVGSKIERIAIAENSYLGVSNFLLSEKDMQVLDGLDEQLPAGRLGIIDGWSADEIKGPTWDPTMTLS